MELEDRARISADPTAMTLHRSAFRRTSGLLASWKDARQLVYV